jgi:hypothetical protein
MRSLIVAVGRYSGSTEVAAEVDGFAAGDNEQALNTSNKAQDKTSERDNLIKTSKEANIQRQLHFENNEV